MRVRARHRGLERIHATRRGGRFICVASGKGGTGKTVIAANLAVLLARRGFDVTLLDADLGLANAHLLLDVTPRHTLAQLLMDGVSPDDLSILGPRGVRLLSGGSGIQEIASLDPADLFLLIRKLERLRSGNDYIVVDTSAGIGPQSLMFLFATREVILVTTPALTSLTDAYAIVKTLFARREEYRIAVVINRVRSAPEAGRAFERIDGAARRFLGHGIESLGYLLEDGHVPAALERRAPLVEAYPACPAARGLRAVERGVRRHALPSRPLPLRVREALAAGRAAPAPRGDGPPHDEPLPRPGFAQPLSPLGLSPLGHRPSRRTP